MTIDQYNEWLRLRNNYETIGLNEEKIKSIFEDYKRSLKTEKSTIESVKDDPRYNENPLTKVVQGNTPDYVPFPGEHTAETTVSKK